MAVLIDAGSRILLQGPIFPDGAPYGAPDGVPHGRAGAAAPPPRLFHASRVVGCVDLDPGRLAAAKLRISDRLSGDPAAASIPDHPPTFPSLEAAVAATGADASLVLAPPEAAADAVLAAIDAGIGLVVMAAETLPEADRRRIRARLAQTQTQTPTQTRTQSQTQSQTRLIGPGCPGIVSPGAAGSVALGGAGRGLPSSLTYARGRVGILSHSADLAREAAWQTTLAGLGQSSVVSLARRQIATRAFADCLSLFVADEATEAIVLIVDPSERIEDELASLLLRGTGAKPVVALVAAGVAAARGPAEARCRETENVMPLEAAAAARQARVLARAGAILVETPAAIGRGLRAALERPERGHRIIGAPWDFAAAVRAVEREYYGPALRLVEGGAPRISS